jgi:hypothetical protein
MLTKQVRPKNVRFANQANGLETGRSRVQIPPGPPRKAASGKVIDGGRQPVAEMVAPMSVAQVKLYCTNCGTKRTYQAGEEVPRQCPQCQRDSRPNYAWLRNKVPFLPVLVSLTLLFSLSLYDLFVTRAQVLPWLPYVVVSILFGTGWMLGTLLKDWPKLPKGPRIVSAIKWARQNATPQELLGVRIEVTLEEHYRKKRFLSTIEGYKPILIDPESDDGYEDYRVYSLRPEQNPLEATHIFFYPEWARFKRGAQRRLRKACKGAFSYRPSIEELLLNQESPLREIYGMIYKVQNPDILAKPKIPWSLLTNMTSAYGKVSPLQRATALPGPG